MWKKEADTGAGRTGSAAPAAKAATQKVARETAPEPTRAPTRGHATIGRSVIIKGELTGSEDFQIDGTVDGTIDLNEHVLTIGPSAAINAEIRAKSVIVEGTVRGNITAVDKIELSENGSIEGDIIAPKVAMAEGSHFRGSIDMQGSRSDSATSSGRTPRRAVATG